MPKAILEFNLDDPHERNAHARAVKSTSAYIALSEIQNSLRSMEKYGSHENDGITNLLQNNECCVELVGLIREVVYQIIEDNDINMNDLE